MASRHIIQYLGPKYLKCLKFVGANKDSLFFSEDDVNSIPNNQNIFENVDTCKQTSKQNNRFSKRTSPIEDSSASALPVPENSGSEISMESAKELSKILTLSGNTSVRGLLYFLGLLTAKALLDQQLVDLQLSKLVYK